MHSCFFLALPAVLICSCARVAGPGDSFQDLAVDAGGDVAAIDVASPDQFSDLPDYVDMAADAPDAPVGQDSGVDALPADVVTDASVDSDQVDAAPDGVYADAFADPGFDSSVPDDPGVDLVQPICLIPAMACMLSGWNPESSTCDESAAPDGTPCQGGACTDGACVAACRPSACPSWLMHDDECHCRTVPTGSDFCLRGLVRVPCDEIASGQEWYGQDGHSYEGARTFVDNGDGTVTDGATGLVWARTPSSAVTLEDAEEYCRTAGGLPGDGWRMPSIQELFNLVDAGDENCMWNPLFGDSCGSSQMFWSSTRAYASANFCTVHRRGNIEACERIDSWPVRCVKGPSDAIPADADRFLVFAEMVFDTVTGIAWENGFGERALSFSDSLSACAALGSGWRLPTTAELVSIVDHSRETDGCAKWSDLLGRFCDGDLYFWSSTPNPVKTSQASAFAIHMLSGHVHENPLSRQFNARCVKDFR